MRYTKAVNIWELSESQIAKLQPGQWVYAGDKKSKGRFWGMRGNGVVVVAWLGNANASKDYTNYNQTQRNYAKGGAR